MSSRRFWWGLATLGAVLGTALPADAQQTPTPTPLFSLHGNAPDRRLGTVVGGAGDVDGDGRSDFVVGTENQLIVVSGATGGNVSPPVVISATASGDFYRATILAVNDVDGDAKGDFVVAAPFMDVGGLPDAGLVALVSGATGRNRWGIGGGEAKQRLGASVALLDQIPGEGPPVLIVGAPGASPGGRARAGGAFFISLSTGTTQWNPLVGVEAGAELGSAVATLGDVDGDSWPDLAISAPLQAYNGNSQAGLVFFVSMLYGKTFVLCAGARADAQCGAVLANAGDINQDGHRDLLVSGSTAVADTVGTGQVEAWSVINGTGRRLSTFPGIAAGESLGLVVAGGSDFDGDGWPDVLVGTPNANVEGQAAAGRVRVLSGRDGRPLFVQSGHAGDRLGSAVAFAGDVNRDGRADIVVGAPFRDALGALDVGLAQVVGMIGN